MMSHSPSLSVLFFFGRLFSPVYAVIMKLRGWAYSQAVLRSCRLPVPVISVGNLAMGGTGKTPMVIYLCRLLQTRHRPAVLSRGYGGRSRQAVNIVSDGMSILMNARDAGDEPLMLAQSLPGVPILTGPKRAVTGKYAVERSMADALVLDDGFQHLALKRDIDLVLFSASAMPIDERVFPGGYLREPTGALQRADAFVVTGVAPENESQVQHYFDSIAIKPDVPVFKGKYAAVDLYAAHEGKGVALERIKGAELSAFCGIAAPKSFFSMAEKLARINDFHTYTDHHPFSQADVNFLTAQAKTMGCQGMITTQKDFVKLQHLDIGFPLWVLRVELKMPQSFDDFIFQRLAEAKGKPTLTSV